MTIHASESNSFGVPARTQTHTQERTHARTHACTRARQHAPPNARIGTIDDHYLIGRIARLTLSASSSIAAGGVGGRGMIEWTVTFPTLCVYVCVCIATRKLETDFGKLKKYILLPLYMLPSKCYMMLRRSLKHQTCSN